MSNVVKLLDPRTQLDMESAEVALIGPNVINSLTFSPNSKSNSSLTINCNPPANNILISRVIKKKMVFSVTLTATNTGTTAIPVVGCFGLRCMPIMAVTNAESLQLNQDNLTSAPVYQYSNVLFNLTHNEYHDRNEFNSFSLTKFDEFQTYSEASAISSNRNPLGLYGNNPYEVNRGLDHPSIEVLTSTPTSATLRVTIYEPLMSLSPLKWGKEGYVYAKSLFWVENMTYSCQFANLNRILSFDPAQGAPGVINIDPVTGVVVNLDSASLTFEYYTPNMSMPSPRNILYDYYQSVVYPTAYSGAPVAPGAQITIVQQTIQLNGIPRRLFCYAKLDPSVETAGTTDTYLALDDSTLPVSMTFNNQQFLNNHDAQQLYMMACRNGLKLSYTQYIKYVGSPLIFEMGVDVGTESDKGQIAQVSGNYQLNLTVRYKNISSQTLSKVTMYVVAVYQGKLDINADQGIRHFINGISAGEVLNAPVDNNLSYKKYENSYGGSFFSKLKSVGRFIKDNKLISKGLSLIPHPYAQRGSELADKFGFGVTGGRYLKRSEL